MIAPEKILALFDEPHKNQGLILHYAYQAMPDLAAEVIRLREIEKAAIPVLNAMDIWLNQGCQCYEEHSCHRGHHDRLREHVALKQALGAE